MDTAMSISERRGLRGLWTNPPRSGLRLIIAPWEYRHLRVFAGVHAASAALLMMLGLLTLGFGGSDTKTYLWTLGWMAAAAAHAAVARWERSIARSIGA